MRLDRYVIREMIVPFLIGTVAVVLMFQINAYMFMAKTYNLERIPLTAIIQYIMFKTPEYMKMTLPVGTSLAAALTITRIARDSELTAMRAAGARILRVVAPVAAFGFLVAVGNFLLVERVIPEATRRANVILMQAGVMALDRSTMESNALIKLGQYSASFGSVKRVGDFKLVIDDVTLFEHPEAGMTVVITADQATYDRGVWNFSGGYYWQLRKGELYLAEPRGAFTVNQKIVVDSLFGSGEREERSIQQLEEKIRSSQKIGINVKEDEIELQSRFSVPAACLVFSVVSPIFGVIFARSGGFTGVLVSFVVVLLYYNAFVVSTQILGKFSWCPVWFAAWTPNLAFVILGLIALRRLE